MLTCRNEYMSYAGWYMKQDGNRLSGFPLRQSILPARYTTGMRQFQWMMAKHEHWREELDRAMLRVKVASIHANRSCQCMLMLMLMFMLMLMLMVMVMVMLMLMIRLMIRLMFMLRFMLMLMLDCV